MNIIEMLIQMQRQISYLDGRLKQERNIEADIDKFTYYKKDQDPHTALIGSKGSLLYASRSIVMPDLNSTVKCLAKMVIFMMSFLTRASSNSVTSLS